MENSNLVMKKICNKCCIEKELNEFHKCRTLKDGFKNECKVCIKLYRENNIDKYKKIENMIYKKSYETFLPYILQMQIMLKNKL